MTFYHFQLEGGQRKTKLETPGRTPGIRAPAAEKLNTCYIPVEYDSRTIPDPAG